jgi:hypothetical protein
MTMRGASNARSAHVCVYAVYAVCLRCVWFVYGVKLYCLNGVCAILHVLQNACVKRGGWQNEEC